jgi:hypothetical protein
MNLTVYFLPVALSWHDGTGFIVHGVLLGRYMAVHGDGVDHNPLEKPSFLVFLASQL